MVPASIQSVTDPVERTRLYMDSVATRWQAVRNTQPSLLHSQFWLDTAAWEAYYQLRRGGEFGIQESDWQDAWNDTVHWDEILTGYELKYLGATPGANAPTKPGAVDPSGEKPGLDPNGTIAAAKAFPWLEVGAVVLVVAVAGGLIYSEI